MRRLFNVRIPVLIAGALALGIFLGYIFSYLQTDIFWLIAIIPFTAILFILCLIFKKKKLLVLTLVLIAVLSGGALRSYYTLENYRTIDVNPNEYYTITGTVEEKGETKYGEYIVIENASADGTRLSGKIIAYLDEVYGDFCDVGYTVSFTSKLNYNDLFPYGKLNYRAEENIKYTCNPYTLIESTYRFSLFGGIRSLIRDTLYDNLSYDTASVCYGMLIGDTQNIDDEALDNFRYGGIAHIFAVSGLHIGLVYGILLFIFKKLHANKYVSAGIIISAIIFYTGICGFTLSSVRAVIMCVAYMVTRLLHVKSDGLNNLGFAVFFILAVTPLSLFSVGFQLSVCAIGGILLLAGGIRRILKKIKIPDKIASGAGATLGAQAGTLPVMTASFGYVSGAGLLLNLLIIPLVTVLFTVMFAGTVISLIIPPASGIIMSYAALPLEATLSFLLTANFEKAVITGFGTGIFIPVYFTVMLVFSDKVNLKALPKSVLSVCGVAVLAVCVLAQTYSPAHGYKVTVSSYTNGGSVLMKSPQGTVLVMTEYASVSRIKSSLIREYSLNLDGVIIIGGPDSVEAYDTELNCNDVYVCFENIDVQPYQTVDIHYVEDFTVCGIDFRYSSGHNLFANIDGVKVLVSDEKTLPSVSCDVLISLYRNYIEETDKVPCDAGELIYFNIPDTEHNAYDYGDLTFYIEERKISF